MTVLNQTITLISSRQGTGRTGSTDIASKNVRASISQPGIRLAIQAEYVGRQIDLLAVIRRSDYLTGYNYAEYKGVRYSIQSVNPSDKALFVRLVLERG